MISQPYAIHWFRRDLRTAGNPALSESYRKFEGRVVGVFCFDKKFLARPDFSVNRFQFFLETLKALREEFPEILFLDTGPADAFPKLFELLRKKKTPLPTQVSWNRDYEPFARERDAKMAGVFEKAGIAVRTERDHLLIEPHEVFKGDDPNAGYQVFTPFSRKWVETFRTPEIYGRIKAQEKGSLPDAPLKWKSLVGDVGHLDVFDDYEAKNRTRATIPIPKAGSRAAMAAVDDFKSRMDQYGEKRDFPATNGTSHFSVYFKNGSLTVPQVIAKLKLKPAAAMPKFLNELIWREFYYSILYRFPHVEKEAFLEKYRAIKWENREGHFKAWIEGMTGFPIVDAGMRQLKQTGWMHNRVRMIVASFLTKDLHVDWRWGEKYFMETLLDGDLAPNNGGWQWAASTGCDPQPYFRIFNPLLQSQRFDPDGDYIRKYVPEIAHLPTKEIHCPAPLDRGGYPQPIVDHAEAKERALELYKV